MSCQVEGCKNTYYALGYCEKHWKKYKKYGDPLGGPRPRGNIEQRFWPKVHKGPGCWIWTGGISKTGYGILAAGGKGAGNLSAHRLSYTLNKGPIPAGMLVLHSCDNRACVNPDHLRAGTHKENIQEAFDKGRKTAPVSYGEDHPKSKLTQEQANFIKANPQFQHAYLARLFGVSLNCIRGVRIGRTWK